MWQNLHLVTETLQREVGRGLREAADLSDTEFSVLARLTSSETALRPSECAQALGWESSRLAHQLGRLERRGLIRRAPEDRDDRRASIVRITDAGRAAHRASVGPHLRAAKYWFADALTDSQLEALDDALATLLSHAETRRSAGV